MSHTMTIAINTLHTSPIKVRMPAFTPRLRMVLVVPTFPLPTLRKSTFSFFPYKKPDKNIPHKYPIPTDITRPNNILLIFLSFPYNEFQGSTLKAKCFPNLIFQISCIRKMHQVLVIYKDNKSWRFYRCLCNII